MTPEATLCLSAVVVLVIAWLGFAAGGEPESEKSGFTALFVVVNFACGGTIVITIGKTLIDAWFR